MGCILSNLETKDTLRRCKERRRLMEEAMFGYNHLAYALVDYLRSLRRTGSSLSSFAEGEPHSSYYLRSRNSTCSFPQGDPSPSPSPEPLPTPTPPPPPQQQQPKMMAFKSPSLNPNPKPKPRGKAKAKVPHILSESSPSSSSLQSGLQAQSTHAGTSSQASSMGYWENIYPPPPPDSEFFNRRSTHSFAKSEDAGSSAASDKTGDILLDKAKMEVRPKDLKEIVDSLKDNFEEAAAAGNEVSDLLEIGRDQQHRSLRQLKKTVYHSRSLLSILISSWTSKPPLAVRYQLDAGSLDDPGGPKSLRSSLERLLAWEEKLYEDIKRREGMRIELKKKLSTLQNQECKGGDQAKLDKTEASIKRLQSLIFVTSQAVSTTSTAIIGLRDSDLVPQLIQLCHGFMHMWRSMNQYHEIQNNIVQQVRGLVNWATDVDSTSELHRQATLDLESDVTAWHSNFCRLIKLQRDFIRSLHGWFKLSLISVTTENINGNRETSDAYAFCEEWKLALERVPDTVASEAIKSFINVVHVISGKQTEELKMKKRTETASKELEKKSSSLRNIEKKFYNSYSMVGIGLPDIGPDNGQVLDARDPLAEKKSELAACKRRVEDEFQRYSKAIEVTRAMTLNNLQTGLPGVFQALTSFSALFTESLQTVCTHSYAIK